MTTESQCNDQLALTQGEASPPPVVKEDQPLPKFGTAALIQMTADALKRKSSEKSEVDEGDEGSEAAAAPLKKPKAAPPCILKRPAGASQPFSNEPKLPAPGYQPPLLWRNVKVYTSIKTKGWRCLVVGKKVDKNIPWTCDRKSGWKAVIKYCKDHGYSN